MKRVFVFAILLAAGIVGHQYYTTGKVDFEALAFWKKTGEQSVTKKGILPQTPGQKVSAAQPGTPKTAQATPASSPTVDVIRLKNGKTIRGTVVIRDDTVTWIRTEDGKRIEMKSRDILSY